MRLFKLIMVISLTLTSIFIITACDKISEIFDTTQKVVKEELMKKQHQAVTQVAEITDNTKRFAQEQLDKTQQQLLTAVSNVTQQLIMETRSWIYETLKPFFPWIFIIFFLLLFAAFKAIIPFSNILIIQLPLVTTSYIISFWLFAKQGLSSFALTGTFWLFIPVSISICIIFLCKNYLKPKLLAMNTNIINSLAGK